MNPTLINEKLTLLRNDTAVFATGSRYWSSIDPLKVPVSETTDYDFVAEFSEQRLNHYFYSGFTLRTGGEKKTIHPVAGTYGDGSTVVVLYYGPIQLILKTQVDVYLRVQNKIGVEFYRNFLWKKHTTIPKIQSVLNALCYAESN